MDSLIIIREKILDEDGHGRTQLDKAREYGYALEQYDLEHRPNMPVAVQNFLWFFRTLLDVCDTQSEILEKGDQLLSDYAKAKASCMDANISLEPMEIRSCLELIQRQTSEKKVEVTIDFIHSHAAVDNTARFFLDYILAAKSNSYETTRTFNEETGKSTSKWGSYEAVYTFNC